MCVRHSISFSGEMLEVQVLFRLLPALEVLTDDDIPTTGDQESYATLLERVIEKLPLLREIVPLFTVFVEWTQKLTATHTPTSSLALDRMDAALNSLDRKRQSLPVGSLKSNLREVVSSFYAQMEIFPNRIQRVLGV